MKNRINHQNDVICYSKTYNKMSNCDCQKNIKKPIEDEVSITTVAATTVKELIAFEDGLLITIVAATAAVILFGLSAVGVGQQSALLTSTSLVHFMFLPA